MPNWQPNWDDVVFDHASAQAAIDECLRAAGALDTVLGGLAGAHSQLDTNGAWQGKYRDDFDDDAPLVASDAATTRDALLDFAGTIADAATAATAEQARREADRDRWQQERHQELARRPPGGRNIPI